MKRVYNDGSYFRKCRGAVVLLHGHAWVVVPGAHLVASQAREARPERPLRPELTILVGLIPSRLVLVRNRGCGAERLREPEQQLILSWRRHFPRVARINVRPQCIFACTWKAQMSARTLCPTRVRPTTWARHLLVFRGNEPDGFGFEARIRWSSAALHMGEGMSRVLGAAAAGRAVEYLQASSQLVQPRRGGDRGGVSQVSLCVKINA